VAQALIEELVVVVVVGPTYIGGSSELLEAEHEPDSVIVKEAVTVIVSAGAVVISMPVVSEFYIRPKQIVNAHPLRSYCL
jgi:hypothetical protein